MPQDHWLKRSQQATSQIFGKTIFKAAKSGLCADLQATGSSPAGSAQASAATGSWSLPFPPPFMTCLNKKDFHKAPQCGHPGIPITTGCRKIRLS